MRKTEGIVKLCLGVVSEKSTEYGKSLEFYKNALNIGKDLDLPEIIWWSSKGIASANAKVGNYDIALNHYKIAIREVENVRKKIRSTDYKSSFFENNIDIYHNLIQLLVNLDSKFPNKDYSKEAYEEQFDLRIDKLLEKLDRIENNFKKEENMPQFFWDVLQEQRDKLLKTKESKGKIILIPSEL